MTDGQKRSLIKPGQKASIVLKKDQRTGKLIEGIVKKILTKSPSQSPWNKGMLEKWTGGKSKSYSQSMNENISNNQFNFLK